MPAESPLDLFGRAIAGASNDELLEAWLLLIVEAANRIDNYVEAIEAGAPGDVRNEAVVFAGRAEHLIGLPLYQASDRVKYLSREIRHGHKYLMRLVEEGVASSAD